MFTKSTVKDCKIVQLPIVHEVGGKLTALNNELDLPFAVKRIYYLYDIPTMSERGGHAHKGLHQYILSVSGGFRLKLYDGKDTKSIFLSKPFEAVHIVPGIWRELDQFTGGTVCLVLASDVYLEEDYIRNIQKFEQLKAL